MKHKKIIIGNDHCGVSLKRQICESLLAKGYEVNNYGTDEELPIDYPDIAHPVAQDVAAKGMIGILICGSAQGVAITANKHRNVRAAICWRLEISELARKHNDSNLLCLPAKFLTISEALQIVEAFLNTEYKKGRHQNRIDKIELECMNIFD